MMNKYFIKKTAALFLTAASLASLTSCGFIEMRDSIVETEKAEAEAGFMLQKAERKNEVETSPIPLDSEGNMFYSYEEPEMTVVRFTAVGDIRIDEHIITDAAKRAGEGNSYSFLKMYSGIYRDIRDADLALGRYSTVSVPWGYENDDKNTPVESLAALSELGFNVLDTGSAKKPDGDCSVKLAGYGIKDIGFTGSDSYTCEYDGIKLAVLSVSADNMEALASDIEAAALTSDVVIASLDWGNTADKDSVVYSAASAGADIIIGAGNELGNAAWIDTGDGTPAIAVYSLGSFIASSDNADELVGGILSVDITLCDGVISLENTGIMPTVIHYTSGNQNYQIFELSEYSYDISVLHALDSVSLERIYADVYNTVNNEFLSEGLS